MKIAVMGYGTIGSGVVEVLEKNADLIAERAGKPLEVKYILDLREFPEDPHRDRIIHDYKTIAEDEEVQIVVEAMGGVEPAYTFVKTMLEAGKSVTTSNKNLVAVKGAELLALAKEKGVNFMFEASVGGGIPIIRALNKCLTAERIEEITGILNGTTNYMLTEMATKASDFDDVLKEAQAKGFAEADPTADIEGYDPCRKIAILTSLAAGKQVDYEEIPAEGITKITAEDFAYARKMGASIKLLATSKRVDETYSCLVAPFLLSSEHPLAGVNGVFNAVFVRGNMLGDAMFYGSGAGKLPTASAVVADIVDIAKHPQVFVPMIWSTERQELADPNEASYSYLIRTTADKAQVEAYFEGKDLTFYEGVCEGEIGCITPLCNSAEFVEVKKNLPVIGSIRLA